MVVLDRVFDNLAVGFQRSAVSAQRSAEPATGIVWDGSRKSFKIIIKATRRVGKR